MAKAGTYTAYQRLKPLDQDFTEDLKNYEDQGFRYREEKRDQQDRKDNQIKEKSKAKVDAFDKLQAPKTGYNSLDEGVADYVYNDLANQLNEQFEILERDPNNWKAQLEIQRITKQPAEIAALTQGLVARKTDLEQGIASGEYSKELNKGKLEAYNELLDNYNFKLGYKNGRTNVFIDTNNDGIDDSAQEGITLEGLIDGSQLGDFVPRWDLKGFVSGKIKEKVATDEKEVQSGFTTETVKKASPAYVNALTKELDDTLGTSLEDMTWQGQSLFADYNIPTPTTEQEFKDAKTDIADRILSSVNTEYKKKIDQSALTSRIAENRRQEEDKVALGEAVTPTKQTYGIYYGNINPDKVNSVNIQGEIKVPAIKTEKGTFVSNAVPHNVTRDKFGRMVAEVSYQDIKTESISKKEYDNLTNKAQSGDQTAAQIIANAFKDDSGSYRVTKPSQVKRKDITVSKEDETLIAGALGLSVKDLDARIYKSSEEKDPLNVLNN